MGRTVAAVDDFFRGKASISLLGGADVLPEIGQTTARHKQHTDEDRKLFLKHDFASV